MGFGEITGTFTFDFEALELLAVDLTVTGDRSPGTYTNPVFLSPFQIEAKNDGNLLKITFDNPLTGAIDPVSDHCCLLTADFNTFTGELHVDNAGHSTTAAAVPVNQAPEPASLALLGGPLCLFLLRRQRSISKTRS